MLQIYTKH